MISATFHRLARQAAFHDAGHGYDVFGLHPPVLASAVESVRMLYERYFRVTSTGIDNIPKTGAAIVVANHGGALPLDAAMLCLDLLRNTDPPRIPRPISDHFVPRLPFVSTLFARLGVVVGTRANVRALLRRGELIATFPEGALALAKPFHQRYQIHSWRVGFADLALHHRVPVIPAAIIGSEESWPVLARVRSFRWFGAPYLPISLPIPLPARYHIHYGKPLYLDSADCANADCADAATEKSLTMSRTDELETASFDPQTIAKAAARVRLALETLIEESLRHRQGVFR